MYRNAGYDFIAITDHFTMTPVTDTRQFHTEDFTTLLGAELHAPRTELGETWHIVAIGLPLDFPLAGRDETGPDLARRAAETGAFIGIAHPAWYGLTLQDAKSISVAHSVEIYNETCAQLNDRGDSWYLCDAMNAEGHRLLAYAADDAHFNPTRPDSCAAWVEVRAETLAPDAILTALKAGDFYSSQGPAILSIERAGETLLVSCSPARAIFVTGKGRCAQSSLGVDITTADFSIDQFEDAYCRVTIIDENGKRAWSNPIWFAQ